MSAASSSQTAARGSFLDFIVQRAGLRPYAVLTLLCALLYLPGISTIPPTDRDEARFMQATKQMIETGDYIHIRFQDEPRNKKPAGIHWLQVGVVKLTGQNLTTFWPYRIPSVIAAWLAALGTCYLGMRFFDRRTGLVAGFVLASSFMVVIEAHIAKTDAMLLAATTAALGALAIIYVRKDEGPPRSAAVVFWLAIAAGALVKGPVSLVVAIATVAALWIADRNVVWLKHTRPLFGLPLTLALTLPWYLASSGGDGGGNNFIVEAVRGDLIPKLIGGQEGHGAPPATHLLASLITAWPWSLLLPFAVLAGWRHRTQPIIRFCLAWLGTTWLVFEIVPTKLPHYTLPAFPALALLIAYGLRENILRPLMQTLAGRIYRGAWVVVTLALAGGIIWAAQTYGTNALFPAAGAALALTGGATAVLLSWRDARAMAVAGAASVAFAMILSAGVIPRLSTLAVSPRLAAAIAPYRAETDKPVALASYSEPSAVFLLGTETLLATSASVTEYLRQNPGAIGVIETENLERISQTVAETGQTLRTLAEVEGYNYSRGDPVNLSVVTVVKQEATP